MPSFREGLVKQIDTEKERRHSLQAQVAAIERSIISLQEGGKGAIKCKLGQLGIAGKQSSVSFPAAKRQLSQLRQETSCSMSPGT